MYEAGKIHFTISDKEYAAWADDPSRKYKQAYPRINPPEKSIFEILAENPLPKEIAEMITKIRD